MQWVFSLFLQMTTEPYKTLGKYRARPGVWDRPINYTRYASVSASIHLSLCKNGTFDDSLQLAT